MVEKWTGKMELEYVDSEGIEKIAARAKDHADLVGVESLISNDGTVIEFGCGAAWGLLPHFGDMAKFAVDPLVQEYVMRGSEPPSVTFTYACRVHEAEPEVVGQHDVVVCIEALDHCDDMNQFHDSQDVLYDCLKMGGILIFMLPPRSEPRNGHPCCPNRHEVVEYFSSLGLKQLPMKYHGEAMWLKMQKVS